MATRTLDVIVKGQLRQVEVKHACRQGIDAASRASVLRRLVLVDKVGVVSEKKSPRHSRMCSPPASKTTPAPAIGVASEVLGCTLHTIYVDVEHLIED